MANLHYFPMLLLLGSLFTTPLDAAYYGNSPNNTQYQEKKPYTNTQTFYTHGDLTFIQTEKDKVNQEALKQGLIELSRRLKAKDGRKVYFFVGAPRAGKSLSITALQGNSIKKVAEEYPDSDDSDDALFDHLDHQQSLLPRAKFEVVSYLFSSKKEVPVVRDGWESTTKSTYIYYPNPKRPQYQEIAFADTESFFGKRKATSAEKCLSATSLFYALKVNSVGGLVLVLSAADLGGMRQQIDMMPFADILATYFAKSVRIQRIKQSVLVMITKVDGKPSKEDTLRQLRQRIQLFYQAYYAATNNEEKIKQLLIEKYTLAERYENLVVKSNQLDEENRDLEETHKHLLLKVATLGENLINIMQEAHTLAQAQTDVSNRRKKMAQKFKKLDKEDKRLEAKIKNLEAATEQLAQSIKSIEQEKRAIKKQSAALDQKFKNLDNAYQKQQEDNRRLKRFFEMLLVQDVPKEQINHLRNFKLDKRLFCFILPWQQKSVQQILDKKLTKLTPIPSHNLSTFDNPVSKYMVARIRDFSLQLNKAIQSLLALRQQIERMAHYTVGAQKHHTLTYNRLIEQWQTQRKIQLHTWRPTVYMLQFFVDEILQDSSTKALIKVHLGNFREATQIASVLPALKIKVNNPKNSSSVEETNASTFYWVEPPTHAAGRHPNGYQSGYLD